MPAFHFEISSPLSLGAIHCDFDLPDVAEAKREATRMAREEAGHLCAAGTPRDIVRIAVTDDRGEPVCDVRSTQ